MQHNLFDPDYHDYLENKQRREMGLLMTDNRHIWKYKVKDPTGKTVGKYKTIKGARKYGYNRQDGIYSHYTIYNYVSQRRVGTIDFMYQKKKGAYWHCNGVTYTIWTDGSITEV